MPPEYLAIFLRDLPDPDAYLGEYEDGDDDQQQPVRTTVDELREDPDVKAVLKAVAIVD
jgi:hypothetical protein